MDLSTILDLFFHLFMIFVVIYSSFALFSLIRYGKSQILGFLISVFYISIISGLYFQTLKLINNL